MKKDLFDILKSIIEEYEEKLLNVFIDQELKKAYPNIWVFSRFNLQKTLKRQDNG